MRPLGKKQLSLLMAMASPGSILLTPVTGEAASLERRGLLVKSARSEAMRITPAGMRALADAYESGKLEQFMRHKFEPHPAASSPREK